ncbi:MAG: PQQ-dependent sugar dehydrogenase [Nitrospiraceae bacterium]|nr:PQQ-dependent sugar dehydrogenase [Nitrospiraceae bacterium]
MGLVQRLITVLATGAAVSVLCACFAVLPPSGGSQAKFTGRRAVNAADIALPRGYRIEAVATDLTFPTGVTFDDEGRIYVIEAGYSYGEVWDTPRLLRIERDGGTTTVATGENNGPWTGVTFHQGAFYIAEGGVFQGGRILRVTPDGRMTVLVEGLPSMGDHQTNGAVIGPDGWLYFGIGTFTNAGVVGEDNYKFGWLARFPRAHDIPCRDVALKGENFMSSNPFTPEKDDTAVTGAFVPFGTKTEFGQVIRGREPCSGSIMRVPLEGGTPELVAWGFRNPFGLAFSPDGRLYVTDNSYDDRERGSRAVHGAGDLLWAVTPGAWYGWPEFHGTRPLNDGDHYIPPGKDQPQPLLVRHPGVPPPPVAIFGVHSSSDGFDFSRAAAFGYVGQAFIAQFGDQSPISGKVLSPVGFKVVRVNVETGVVEDFAVNRGRTNGPASKVGGGGLERPVAARFTPSGSELYVVDFGVMTVGQGGKVRRPWASKAVASESRRGTGVLWRITRGSLEGRR